MNQTLVSRLRVKASERGHQGTPESREACITMFLKEAGELFSDLVLLAQDEDVLATFYEGWIGQASKGASEEQRVMAMAEAVLLNTGSMHFKVPKEPEQPSAGVVQLFR